MTHGNIDTNIEMDNRERLQACFSEARNLHYPTPEQEKR
jgi:hypothetical protein